MAPVIGTGITGAMDSISEFSLLQKVFLIQKP